MWKWWPYSCDFVCRRKEESWRPYQVSNKGDAWQPCSSLPKSAVLGRYFALVHCQWIWVLPSLWMFAINFVPKMLPKIWAELLFNCLAWRNVWWTVPSQSKLIISMLIMFGPLSSLWFWRRHLVLSPSLLVHFSWVWSKTEFRCIFVSCHRSHLTHTTVSDDHWEELQRAVPLAWFWRQVWDLLYMPLYFDFFFNFHTEHNMGPGVA